MHKIEGESATIKCSQKGCKAENPLDVEYCVECAHPIFEEKEPPKSSSEKARINKDLVVC